MSSPAAPARRPGPSALVAVLLVLLAGTAVVLTVAHTVAAPARVPGTTRALVARTDLGCPDGALASGLDTGVDIGLAPAAGASAGGTVRRGPVGVPGTPTRLARGHLVEVPTGGGPRVSAIGPAAPGLVGFRSDRSAGKRLALIGCDQPRARWWFTGAGAGLDHTSSLRLANLDPGPAVVDLRVLGPDGAVDEAGSRGIVVAPDSVKRIELADVAPQTDDLSLEVSAQRGRVVAAVGDARRPRAGAAAGSEWLPATDREARTLLLAGLPPRAERRTLLVANPSDLEAVVDVEVSGRSGRFTPSGLRPVTVAPGALGTVDLPRTVPRDEPVALRLRSRQPVLAAVRSEGKGDEAVAGPVRTLTGPASAPLVTGSRATVQLTAGDAEARVRVRSYGTQGRRLDGTTFSVPATATRGWSPEAGAAYVVVSPRRGDTVSGAVTYAGDGLAAVSLTPLPLREQRPPVRPGLR